MAKFSGIIVFVALILCIVLISQTVEGRFSIINSLQRNKVGAANETKKNVVKVKQNGFFFRCVTEKLHCVSLLQKFRLIKNLNFYVVFFAGGMCYEPMLQQNCPKKEWRFFFDMTTHRCYGKMACPGGANNFKSWHECQNACARFMSV